MSDEDRELCLMKTRGGIFMYQRLVFATLLMLASIVSYGQDCNCVSNFEWIKKTFEENDAGSQHIIDKKGRAAYETHNQLILGKVKEVKTAQEFVLTMEEWFNFFRTQHIGIEWLGNLSDTIAKPTTATVTAQQATPKQTAAIKSYETVKVDIPEFEKYIKSKTVVDFEGIWQMDAYKIGIKKEEGEGYIGFIIESGFEEWKPGQLKLKIKEEGDSIKWIYYARDHSVVEGVSTEKLGDNYLFIFGLLKRLSPVFPNDPYVENYIKAMATEKPFLDKLNAKTLYLRLPSFDKSQKKYIDSVIVANKDKILKTENLIIDLRNNGGGLDLSWSEVVPFLYTNPVRTPSIAFLSTKLNNQRFLELSKDTIYGYSEGLKKWQKESYEKLEQHLGEYVNIHVGGGAITMNFSKIYAYPKNVGIIINKGNGSSAEQFLLTAQQSKKVKLFGVTTLGCLDISNMLIVESPCKEFKLWYAMSRSLWLPDMALDGIGIKPDFYLDKSIPQYQWVQYVNNILNHK